MTDEPLDDVAVPDADFTESFEFTPGPVEMALKRIIEVGAPYENVPFADDTFLSSILGEDPPDAEDAFKPDEDLPDSWTEDQVAQYHAALGTGRSAYRKFAAALRQSYALTLHGMDVVDELAERERRAAEGGE